MNENVTTAESHGTNTGAAASIEKIKALLKAKDDTQRFVGLALLKSVLDNSPELQEDQQIIESLWTSISPKFLDRLLKTGSTPSNKDAKDMLDLSVSILHTFSLLLPASALADPRFTDRIPHLVAAALHSRDETTTLLLQLLNTLVNSPKGAATMVDIQDLSPLIEMAPSQPLAMSVISFAWLNAMETGYSIESLSQSIHANLKLFVSSFTGTDAVTLLEFLGNFLRQAKKTILPSEAPWLGTVINFIKKLVASRPTPEARAAYTNAAASLLQTYPLEAAKALFVEDPKDEKPFGYLFINLLLIDIRSSAPMLLEQLNSPNYPQTSRRLASGFDVISIFIGFLLRSLDDDGPTFMQPENLLRLRKGIAETMSVTIEYLRDRWDASVAGAMGLHPDTRTGTIETSTGTNRTLAWDSMKNSADEDPFTLSALRALSLWLREDDNEMLRKEATGLMDMLMDIYRGSSPETLDFRGPVLVALEGLVQIEEGRDLLLKQDGWKVLVKDLSSIIRLPTEAISESDATRGIDVVRVLLPVVEQERTGTAEEWMDLITTVAAWNISESPSNNASLEFQIAVLQICSTLLVRANPGMRARYVHSIQSIKGLAATIAESARQDVSMQEQMDDVRNALVSII